MALVAAAAFLMAMLFLIFKVLAMRGIPLLPAIAVNYAVAVTAGLLFAPPWNAGDLRPLWWPALALGLFFVLNFHLTALSTQRAGVAATTVASRMSLVLTVIAAVLLYDEQPGAYGWIGISLAIVAVVFASLPNERNALKGTWMLPVLIFFGNAVIDIGINWMQRTRVTPETEEVLPTITFISAAVVSAIWAIKQEGLRTLVDRSVLIGGSILGIVNYAALMMIVKGLMYGGFPASSFYPLMNVCVILIATLISVLAFGERMRPLRTLGIAIAVLALMVMLYAKA